MKTLIHVCYCIFLCALFLEAKDALPIGNEAKEYDKIFDKIAERRVGIDNSQLDKLQNPFSLNSDSGDLNSTAEVVYYLQAILDKKAKINGIWYNLKDSIDGFKLVKIDYSSVMLQNESEKKEIFIRTKDETNIKIFSK